jgi:hypothetical protein
VRERRIEERHHGSGPVDPRDVLDLDVLAEPEEVRVVQAEVVPVDPSRATETEAGAEGPDVPCCDHDVDRVPVVVHGPDLRVVEVAVVPEMTLRLVEHAPRVGVALGEAELAPDHPFVRRHVELVRRTEDRLVLLGVVGVEDRPGVDLDLADDGACRLERGVVGDRVALLGLGRRPRGEGESPHRGSDEPYGGGPFHETSLGSRPEHGPNGERWGALSFVTCASWWSRTSVRCGPSSSRRSRRPGSPSKGSRPTRPPTAVFWRAVWPASFSTGCSRTGPE